MHASEQIQAWAGEFGRAYTQRNNASVREYDDFMKQTFGKSQTELIHEFLDDRGIESALEVGSNIGRQLMLLRKAGVSRVYGIEIQQDAVRATTQDPEKQDIQIINASGLEIPFRERSFDLVFTHGVLIHVAPEDIVRCMREMYRCSRRYLWGHEYYADGYHSLVYHGKENLLWKANFAQIFMDSFPDLRLVKQERYCEDGNPDKQTNIYLLEKEAKP